MVVGDGVRGWDEGLGSGVGIRGWGQRLGARGCLGSGVKVEIGFEFGFGLGFEMV